MTDYLEEIGGEKADALLEVERRLAAALAGAAAGVSGQLEALPDLDREIRIRDSLARSRPAEWELEELPSGGDRKAERLPLLEAVEALARMDSRPETGRRTAAEAETPRLPGTGGLERWPAQAREENGRGEEADRAERMDRIFRRDSRRYDGGFFLY